MTQLKELRSSDGFVFTVHHEVPRGVNQGCAIVLLPEVYGLTPFMVGLAAQYASYGYEVILPALLDRSQRNLVVGYDAPGIARAHGLAHFLGNEKPLLDIQAVVRHFTLARKPVALVGYGWGASLAYLGGCYLKDIACIVGYYGNEIANFSRQSITIPTLLHFARHDHNIPRGDVEHIRAANPTAEIEVYETKAGFAASDRPAQYDADCTAQAHRRTVAFLKEHLQKKDKKKAGTKTKSGG